MLDAGWREEGMLSVLNRRSQRDDRSRMEDECRRCDHVGTAAKAGVARGLGLIVIIVLTRNPGRDVALVRLQQIAGEHFYCHKEQQKHGRKPKKLGQDLHHPHFATGTGQIDLLSFLLRLFSKSSSESEGTSNADAFHCASCFMPLRWPDGVTCP